MHPPTRLIGVVGVLVVMLTLYGVMPTIISCATMWFVWAAATGGFAR